MTRAWLVLAVCACNTRPAEDRAREELDVGLAETNGATVEVKDGLAAVRSLGPGALGLWCNAPAIDVALQLDASMAGTWTITAQNAVTDAVLVIERDGTRQLIPRDPGGDRPTTATFTVALADGRHALRIAPLDAERVEPFRVVAMADIQTALPDVDDVFTAISGVPDARYVIAMGDITERGEESEYDLFETQLATLAIPFYTTLGNHELWQPASHYFRRFGRASFHFEFKGTAFTFADSGDAGIDPIVEEWLDGWLARSLDQPHVFLTHIPPIDPVGTRYGSFRSSRDGYRLLARLVEGNVDLTLYGHIHTFIEYENGGIPAYVSGGGGAEPMLGDGIDRHFLVIDFDGDQQRVTVQRVD